MFFSFNPSAYKSPKICKLTNGTQVYYQESDLGCSCLASIRADPDFAGPAIIASFLFIGWLTIAIAAVPTGRSVWFTWLNTSNQTGFRRILTWFGDIIKFEPNDYMQRRTSIIGFPTRHVYRPRDSVASIVQPHNWNESFNPDSGSDSKQPLPSSRPFLNVDPEPPYCTFARRIVFQLCDLQIIYGIAILVSALAQLDRLTFYHAQFAEQFWWMTLNSFWISRIDYSRNTPEMCTWRAHARRTATWVSVALSIVVQSFVTYREHIHWDPTAPGRCYVADGTGTSFGQNLFWLCGTGIYFLVMSLSMTPWTRRWWDEKVNARIEPSIRAMQTWVTDAYAHAKSQKVVMRENNTSLPRRLIQTTILYGKVASYTLAWITWWAVVFFLTIWCAGNSAAAVEVVLYSIFMGFLTWWVLFLKIQNKILIRGDENRWTYGQTLPLLLLIFVAFHSLDVWAGVKRDEAEKTRGRVDVETLRATGLGPELVVDFANPHVRSRIDTKASSGASLPDVRLRPDSEITAGVRPSISPSSLTEKSLSAKGQ